MGLHSWRRGVAAAVLLTGCLGGQSGNDVYEPPIEITTLVRCPCQLAARGVVLRGTVASFDRCGEASVRVEEVLAAGQRMPLAPGDLVTGLPLDCSDLDLTAGDEVLVVFAEAPDPGSSAQLLVRRWAPEYRFQEGPESASFGQDELSVFANTTACNARFEASTGAAEAGSGALEAPLLDGGVPSVEGPIVFPGEPDEGQPSGPTDTEAPEPEPVGGACPGPET